MSTTSRGFLFTKYGYATKKQNIIIKIRTGIFSVKCENKYFPYEIGNTYETHYELSFMSPRTPFM